jgi:uncharacterized glyoxalase superfamily protein PhnB/heme-degrading monooxygenase HmoA
MAFARAWEYEVLPEMERSFLRHYDAEGSWVQLFRRAPGYTATELYRDRVQAGRYVTVDHWVSEAAYLEFRRSFDAEYEALDRACAVLTRREAHLGDLEAVATGRVVECVVPILSVRSLRDSLRYYQEILGFGPEWGTEHGSAMASVARDGKSIMLCEGGQGHAGTWVWIGVEDVEPLFQELSRRGAKIRQEPINRPWACEMQVEDPDGHVLRFGSEPLPSA